MLGPVAGGVGLEGEAGVDLVDEPVDQIRLAADMGVEGGGATPRRSARRRMDRAPGPCSSSRARASLMISSRDRKPRGRVLLLVSSAIAQ